jgi:hypothetical protein
MGQGACQLLKKKLLTFSITALVLGGSFAAIYGLSQAQNDY